MSTKQNRLLSLKNRKIVRKNNSKRFVSYLLPSLLGVLVFFIIPFFVVIYYSVVDGIVNPRFVFLDNFINVLKNQAFHLAVKNTLKFSIISVTLVIVLSLGLAVALDMNIPAKSQLRTCFLSPLMVPTASVILVFQVLFDYNGTVNDILEIVGINGIDWLKSQHAQVVVIVLFLWKNLGYNMILFMSALGSIPKEIVEVAYLENANKFQIFFKIKLRYISSSILFVTILSLINSFKVFREVYLLSGEYPYDSLYMLQHFMNNTFLALDYQKLSAAAIIMSIFMIIIIGILFLVENHYGKDMEE